MPKIAVMNDKLAIDEEHIDFFLPEITPTNLDLTKEVIFSQVMLCYDHKIKVQALSIDKCLSGISCLSTYSLSHCL